MRAGTKVTSGKERLHVGWRARRSWILGLSKALAPPADRHRSLPRDTWPKLQTRLPNPIVLTLLTYAGHAMLVTQKIG
jgi:hypothetical protein